MTLYIVENAERDDETGDYIYTHKVRSLAGGTKTIELNVSKLFTPGERRTGNIDHLVVEAELHAEGKGGENPAKPANADVAKRAIEKIEEKGLEPAWRTVEDRCEYP